MAANNFKLLCLVVAHRTDARKIDTCLDSLTNKWKTSRVSSLYNVIDFQKYLLLWLRTSNILNISSEGPQTPTASSICLAILQLCGHIGGESLMSCWLNTVMNLNHIHNIQLNQFNLPVLTSVQCTLTKTGHYSQVRFCRGHMNYKEINM